jgi:hypothetical protein
VHILTAENKNIYGQTFMKDGENHDTDERSFEMKENKSSS